MATPQSAYHIPAGPTPVAYNLNAMSFSPQQYAPQEHLTPQQPVQQQVYQQHYQNNYQPTHGGHRQQYDMYNNNNNNYNNNRHHNQHYQRNNNYNHNGYYQQQYQAHNYNQIQVPVQYTQEPQQIQQIQQQQQQQQQPTQFSQPQPQTPPTEQPVTQQPAQINTPVPQHGLQIYTPQQQQQQQQQHQQYNTGNNNANYRYNNNNGQNRQYNGTNLRYGNYNNKNNNYHNNNRHNNNNNNGYQTKPVHDAFSGPVTDAAGRTWSSILEKDIFSDRDAITRVIDSYESIPVSVRGANVPKPFESVEDVGFVPEITSNLQLAGYTNLTPIQKHSISYVLSRRDIIASAQTGSGKTGAFLLPIVQSLLTQFNQGGWGLTGSYNNGFVPPRQQRPPVTTLAPKALILAPTRELSTQIAKEAKKFTYKTPLRIGLVYGGIAYEQQFSQLSHGCEILVATPGRLTEFCQRKDVSLASVQFFVLDEADRMLDMGFLPQIKDIVTSYQLPSKSTLESTTAYEARLKQHYEAAAANAAAISQVEGLQSQPISQPAPLPTTRQTFMFSATFPKEVQQLAADFLFDSVFVTVGRVGSSTELITQSVHQVSTSLIEKQALLLTIIQEQIQKKPTLIFVQTKKTADLLETFLQGNRLRCLAIHGDKSQKQRENALQNFSLQRAQFLVATDVAARGLSIVPSVEYVINFDLPTHIDNYVHRIGRTGRCGAEGNAISFVTTENDNIIEELVTVMKESKQTVPDWLQAMVPQHPAPQHHYNRGYSQYGRNNNNNNRYGYRHNNGYNNQYNNNRHNNLHPQQQRHQQQSYQNNQNTPQVQVSVTATLDTAVQQQQQQQQHQQVVPNIVPQQPYQRHYQPRHNNNNNMHHNRHQNHHIHQPQQRSMQHQQPRHPPQHQQPQ